MMFYMSKVPLGRPLRVICSLIDLFKDGVPEVYPDKP